MQTVGMIGLFIFLVLMIICAFKESKTTAFYKTLGIYGRLRAYFFAGGVIGMPLAIIVLLALPDVREEGVELIIGMALFALLAAGIYFYTLNRCPEVLQKHLFLDMLISGLGINMKVCIFFLVFVWSLDAPREMTDEDGDTVYVSPHGDVYNPRGEVIGSMDGPSSYIKYKRV